MCDNETFKIQCVTMRHLTYNAWQWDIYNTMCDNEIFTIQCVTMRHLCDTIQMCDTMRQLQCVTQWDISNTMRDTMRHFKNKVWQSDIYNTMCDNETFSNTMCDNETFNNTMCDNETFKIQWVTMRHLTYNAWQWDIYNTMCDTMGHVKYNVWHNGTCQIQCVTKWDI